MNANARLGSAIIISLIAGSAGGYTVGQRNAMTAYERGLAQGTKEATQRINEKFVQQGMSSSLDRPMQDAYGFVKGISPDGFTFEFDSAQFSVVEGGMRTVTVRAGGSAKILKLVTVETASAMPEPERPKAPAPQQPPAGNGPQGLTDEEIKRLVGSGKPGGTGGGQMTETTSTQPAPPETFQPKGALGTEQLRDASLADLKVGDYVHVTTEEDMRTNGTVTAKELTIYDKSFLPAGADPRSLPFSRGEAKVFEAPQPYMPTPPQPAMP